MQVVREAICPTSERQFPDLYFVKCLWILFRRIQDTLMDFHSGEGLRQPLFAPPTGNLLGKFLVICFDHHVAHRLVGCREKLQRNHLWFCQLSPPYSNGAVHLRARSISRLYGIHVKPRGNSRQVQPLVLHTGAPLNMLCQFHSRRVAGPHR